MRRQLGMSRSFHRIITDCAKRNRLAKAWGRAQDEYKAAIRSGSPRAVDLRAAEMDAYKAFKEADWSCTAAHRSPYRDLYRDQDPRKRRKGRRSR